MIEKLIIEILILWIIYALYMAILVHKRGPLGGIFFYPKVMQERVIEIGLMTDRGIKKTKNLCLYPASGVDDPDSWFYDPAYQWSADIF